MGFTRLPASLTKTSTLFLLLFLGWFFFFPYCSWPKRPESCELLCRGEPGTALPRGNHTHVKQSCPEKAAAALPCLHTQRWEEMTSHSQPRRAWHHHTCTRGATVASAALCPKEGASTPTASITIARGEVQLPGVSSRLLLPLGAFSSSVSPPCCWGQSCAMWRGARNHMWERGKLFQEQFEILALVQYGLRHSRENSHLPGN